MDTVVRLLLLCVLVSHFPERAQAQTPLVTIFARMCLADAPAVCIQEVVTDSTMSDVTMGACMGGLGQISAMRFAAEHPLYRSRWTFQGWSCQLGARLNERRA
jgi:hypothetical protein